MTQENQKEDKAMSNKQNPELIRHRDQDPSIGSALENYHADREQNLKIQEVFAAAYNKPTPEHAAKFRDLAGNVTEPFQGTISQIKTSALEAKRVSELPLVEQTAEYQRSLEALEKFKAELTKKFQDTLKFKENVTSLRDSFALSTADWVDKLGAWIDAGSKYQASLPENDVLTQEISNQVEDMKLLSAFLKTNQTFVSGVLSELVATLPSIEDQSLNLAQPEVVYGNAPIEFTGVAKYVGKISAALLLAMLGANVDRAAAQTQDTHTGPATNAIPLPMCESNTLIGEHNVQSLHDFVHMSRFLVDVCQQIPPIPVGESVRGVAIDVLNALTVPTGDHAENQIWHQQMLKNLDREGLTHMQAPVVADLYNPATSESPLHNQAPVVADGYNEGADDVRSNDLEHSDPEKSAGPLLSPEALASRLPIVVVTPDGDITTEFTLGAYAAESSQLTRARAQIEEAFEVYETDPAVTDEMRKLVQEAQWELVVTTVASKKEVGQNVGVSNINKLLQGDTVFALRLAAGQQLPEGYEAGDYIFTLRSKDGEAFPFFINQGALSNTLNEGWLASGHEGSIGNNITFFFNTENSAQGSLNRIDASADGKVRASLLIEEVLPIAATNPEQAYTIWRFLPDEVTQLLGKDNTFQIVATPESDTKYTVTIIDENGEKKEEVKLDGNFRVSQEQDPTNIINGLRADTAVKAELAKMLEQGIVTISPDGLLYNTQLDAYFLDNGFDAESGWFREVGEMNNVIGQEQTLFFSQVGSPVDSIRFTNNTESTSTVQQIVTGIEQQTGFSFTGKPLFIVLSHGSNDATGQVNIVTTDSPTGEDISISAQWRENYNLLTINIPAFLFDQPMHNGSNGDVYGYDTEGEALLGSYILKGMLAIAKGGISAPYEIVTDSGTVGPAKPFVKDLIYGGVPLIDTNEPQSQQ